MRTADMRRPVVVLALASVAFLPAGCSSSSSPSSSSGSTAPAASTAAAAPDTIIIQNFAFHPASLTVQPGAKVTVTNEDSTTHTVTATGAKAFDTGDVAPGKTVTFTAPTTAGAYAYICSIHQYMQGTLTVS
jgi:plastocyanin